MNKIPNLVRHPMVNLHVLWIRLSRLWRKIWYIPSIQPETQARLLAKTSTSWIYLTAPIAPPRTIKVSKNATMLRREYELHVEIALTFKTLQEELGNDGVNVDLPYIPECYYFYPEISDSIYGEMMKYFDSKKAAGFTMEYIHPFSPTHAQQLIRRHLPTIRHRNVQPLEHFLAKVYMGDTKPSLTHKWTADEHGCVAYIDLLYSERVNVQALSSTMGATLAIFHWCCGIDAAGVEFIIGRNKNGNIQLWLMDFGECRTFASAPQGIITQLVDAVIHNEPCWPKHIDLHGLHDIWEAFRTAYLQISDYILKGVSDDSNLRFLPLQFINELESLRGPSGIMN